jgi:hypothetical protein
VEYAILIFLIIVVGFLGYKYLGGEVSKSTEASGKTFREGESGQTVQTGKATGGAGGKPQPAAGAPPEDHSKTGAAGGAKVVTVPTTGGPVNADNTGKGKRAAAEEGTGRPRNWVRFLAIAIVVLGVMAAIFQFGKKGKKTAS